MASVDMCEHEWPGTGCEECKAEARERAQQTEQDEADNSYHTHEFAKAQAKPAPAQDEREAFEASFKTLEAGLSLDGIYALFMAKEIYWQGWQARAARPAQTEQQPEIDYKRKFECLVEHAKRQDRVIAEMRYDENIRRFYDDGAVWFWAGDDSDNLETLACPVVINAGDLRALIAQAAPQPEQNVISAVLMAQINKPADLVTGTSNWAAYIARAALCKGDT